MTVGVYRFKRISEATFFIYALHFNWIMQIWATRKLLGNKRFLPTNHGYDRNKNEFGEVTLSFSFIVKFSLNGINLLVLITRKLGLLVRVV